MTTSTSRRSYYDLGVTHGNMKCSSQQSTRPTYCVMLGPRHENIALTTISLIYSDKICTHSSGDSKPYKNIIQSLKNTMIKLYRRGNVSVSSAKR